MLFFVGNYLISWSRKKQNSVALFMEDTKHVAAGSCCVQFPSNEIILDDYGLKLKIFQYFLITQILVTSPKSIQHSITKHIDLWHHSLKDHVPKANIILEFVSTKNRITDVFTKTLPPKIFQN